MKQKIKLITGFLATLGGIAIIYFKELNTETFLMCLGVVLILLGAKILLFGFLENYDK